MQQRFSQTHRSNHLDLIVGVYPCHCCIRQWANLNVCTFQMDKVEVGNRMAAQRDDASGASRLAAASTTTINVWPNSLPPFLSIA